VSVEVLILGLWATERRWRGEVTREGKVEEMGEEEREKEEVAGRVNESRERRRRDSRRADRRALLTQQRECG
jgi:hypothetical protein